MKKAFLIIWTTVLSFLPTVSLQAQTNSLTTEELEIFRTEVKNRVNRFQMYLTYIGSKQNDKETKAAYVKQALKLFIGNGEKYQDIDGNMQPAVRTQVSSKSTNRKSWINTKTYLNNLTNIRYKKVEITWADICRVGNFHKVREGLYVTTVTISQRFKGYWDSGSYTDTTDKTITVYLQEEISPAGGRFRILFGDIEVIQTY